MLEIKICISFNISKFAMKHLVNPNECFNAVKHKIKRAIENTHIWQCDMFAIDHRAGNPTKIEYQ